MNGKVVILTAILTFVNSSAIRPHLRYTAAVPIVAKANYDSHPQYVYGYAVNDAITGDYKSQYESRNGNFVQGQYSLIESDGTKRVVDYQADSVNGFNAVVSKQPIVASAAVVPALVAEHAIPYATYNSYYPYGQYPYSGHYSYHGYPYPRYY